MEGTRVSQLYVRVHEIRTSIGRTKNGKDATKQEIGQNGDKSDRMRMHEREMRKALGFT